MKLEETSIYPYIKSYPELHKLYRIPASNVVVSPINNDEDSYIWFLVNGKVKIETEGTNGKKIIVDILTEDNYVGHLSNLFGHNFYCTTVTVITSTFIRIPIKQFQEMVNKDIRFQRHFNCKVISRLYTMYKKDLASHLFSQQEQIAAYIIEHEIEEVCHISNVKNICEILRSSRRNSYNILNKMEEQGLIEYVEGGDVYIRDYEKLKLEAQPVLDFFNNSI